MYNSRTYLRQPMETSDWVYEDGQACESERTRVSGRRATSLRKLCVRYMCWQTHSSRWTVKAKVRRGQGKRKGDDVREDERTTMTSMTRDSTVIQCTHVLYATSTGPSARFSTSWLFVSLIQLSCSSSDLRSTCTHLSICCTGHASL
jgi:hypothetical protein